MPVPTPSNILVGIGDVYVDYGHSGSWTYLGGFREGVRIPIATERTQVKGYDQNLGFVRSVRTNVEITISVALTEMTFANLGYAVGIEAGFIQANSYMVLGFANVQSPSAVRFVGEDDGGQLKTWIFSEAFPTGNAELAYTRDAEVRVPAEFLVAGKVIAGTPSADRYSTVFGVVVANSVVTMAF